MREKSDELAKEIMDQIELQRSKMIFDSNELYLEIFDLIEEFTGETQEETDKQLLELIP